MANCYAVCIGSDRSRDKQDHRCGSVSAEGRAQTWRTKARCRVDKDGSGIMQLERDGHLIVEISFGAESLPNSATVYAGHGREVILIDDRNAEIVSCGDDNA